MKNILCIVSLFFCTFLFADSPEKLYLEPEDETCKRNDGKIKAHIASGTQPLTFSWSTGETKTVNGFSHTIENLVAGQYSCTVVDSHGCTAIESTTVELELDTIPPIAKCKDFSVTLDSSGNASITAADIDDGSTDECKIDTITVSPSMFTCVNLGSNTVTLRVTDEEGNTGTCAATVTVKGDCCGDTIYDHNTQECCDTTIYDPGTHACCGDEVYDTSTEACCDSTTVYDSSTHACCDGATYDTNTEICCDGSVYNSSSDGCCEGMVYDTYTEQCCGPDADNPGIQPIGVECDTTGGSGSGNMMRRTQALIENDEIYYQSLSLEVFPNPVSDVLNLFVKSPISSTAQIEIYNIQGDQIYETTSYILKGDYSRQIRLPDSTPSGTYLVTIKVGEDAATQKIIVLKQ